MYAVACAQICQSSVNRQIAGRCPGVFKHSRGCGAPLLWCPFPSQQAGPGEAPGYYRCTSFDCSFTEVPQARLLSPIMALEALSATEIKVTHLKHTYLAAHWSLLRTALEIVAAS